MEDAHGSNTQLILTVPPHGALPRARGGDSGCVLHEGEGRAVHCVTMLAEARFVRSKRTLRLRIATRSSKLPISAASMESARNPRSELPLTSSLIKELLS